MARGIAETESGKSKRSGDILAWRQTSLIPTGKTDKKGIVSGETRGYVFLHCPFERYVIDNS